MGFLDFIRNLIFGTIEDTKPTIGKNKSSSKLPKRSKNSGPFDPEFLVEALINLFKPEPVKQAEEVMDVLIQQVNKQNHETSTSNTTQETSASNTTQETSILKKPPKYLSPSIIRALMPESIRGYFKRHPAGRGPIANRIKPPIEPIPKPPIEPIPKPPIEPIRPIPPKPQPPTEPKPPVMPIRPGPPKKIGPVKPGPIPKSPNKPNSKSKSNKKKRPNIISVSNFFKPFSHFF